MVSSPPNIARGGFRGDPVITSILIQLAIARCDLAALRQEASRLRVEVARAEFDPEVRYRALVAWREIARAINFCDASPV